jgi:hypothetical protein
MEGKQLLKFYDTAENKMHDDFETDYALDLVQMLCDYAIDTEIKAAVKNTDSAQNIKDNTKIRK